jgi:hypothetical protein
MVTDTATGEINIKFVLRVQQSSQPDCQVDFCRISARLSQITCVRLAR